MNLIKRNRYRIAWFSLMVAFAIGLSRFNLFAIYKLWTHQVVTTGIVVKYERDNHNTVFYTFKIGKGIISTGSSFHNLTNEDLKPGSVIKVWYAMDNPKNNAIEEPYSIFLNEIMTVMLGVTLFPLMIVLRFYRMK